MTPMTRYPDDADDADDADGADDADDAATSWALLSDVATDNHRAPSLYRRAPAVHRRQAPFAIRAEVSRAWPGPASSGSGSFRRKRESYRRRPVRGRQR